MEPIRIRCRPANLFVYDRWVMVDAIIQRSHLLDRLGQAFYDLPTVTAGTPANDLIACDLPLESRTRNGHQYWAASWCDVQALQLRQDNSAWVRQNPDLDGVSYLHGKRLLIKDWQGPDKLYNMPISLRTVAELTWYAVGDGAEIGRLLNTYVHAIGKKAAYGNGALQSYDDGQCWQVEAWPHDWSERDAAGALTRGLPPAGDLDLAANWQLYGVRPPYFVSANQMLLELPA